MTRPWTRWKPEEIATLRAIAPLGIRELMRALPSHPRSGIQSKATALKVRIGPPDRSYTSSLRWRGRLRAPPHAHPIVRRLYDEINRQKATLTEVADRAGSDRHAITNAAYQTDPRLSELQAWLNVLGLDLHVGPMREGTGRVISANGGALPPPHGDGT
jgi:hypothetical protein